MTGKLFTETSDYVYFSEILWSSSYSQTWHFCVTYVEILTRSGARDFTPFGEFMISLYMHYIICQSKEYVYGLMTRISRTALSWTYFIWLNWHLVDWNTKSTDIKHINILEESGGAYVYGKRLCVMILMRNTYWWGHIQWEILIAWDTFWGWKYLWVHTFVCVTHFRQWAHFW